MMIMTRWFVSLFLNGVPRAVLYMTWKFQTHKGLLTAIYNLHLHTKRSHFGNTFSKVAGSKWKHLLTSDVFTYVFFSSHALVDMSRFAKEKRSKAAHSTITFLWCVAPLGKKTEKIAKAIRCGHLDLAPSARAEPRPFSSLSPARSFQQVDMIDQFGLTLHRLLLRDPFFMTSFPW